MAKNTTNFIPSGMTAATICGTDATISLPISEAEKVFSRTKTSNDDTISLSAKWVFGDQKNHQYHFKVTCFIKQDTDKLKQLFLQVSERFVINLILNFKKRPEWWEEFMRTCDIKRVSVNYWDSSIRDCMVLGQEAYGNEIPDFLDKIRRMLYSLGVKGRRTYCQGNCEWLLTEDGHRLTAKIDEDRGDYVKLTLETTYLEENNEVVSDETVVSSLANLTGIDKAKLQAGCFSLLIKRAERDNPTIYK